MDLNDLRAALLAVARQQGGRIRISHEQMYNAMMDLETGKADVEIWRLEDPIAWVVNVKEELKVEVPGVIEGKVVSTPADEWFKATGTVFGPTIGNRP